MRLMNLFLVAGALALAACGAAATAEGDAKPYEGKTETVMLAVEGMT